MDNRLLRTFFIGIFSYFISCSAIANNNDQINDIWKIIHAEGLSQYKSIKGAATDDKWKTIQLGENLIGPIYLRTGQDSRIILKHRNDKITIASNSLLKLEAETYNDEGILTQIIQNIGYALFDIEKNSGRTNIVKTPYLVSVVKGTTFTVQASKNRATVNLIEGRLQINATNTNASTIIHTGQIAQRAKGDKGISVIETTAQVKPKTTINARSTKAAKHSGNATKKNNNHSLSHSSSASNSNSNRTMTVPASINSVVKKTAFEAGKSGKIVFPGNNGNNGNGVNK